MYSVWISEQTANISQRRISCPILKIATWRVYCGLRIIDPIIYLIFWRRIKWFLVNDKIYTRLFSMYLFRFSTYFEQPRAHRKENQLYQYNIWHISFCVGDRFVCRSDRTFPTCTRNGHRHKWHIPDVVLIKLILLMISTRLLETCRELK
jgi:hypothetical protein